MQNQSSPLLNRSTEDGEIGESAVSRVVEEHKLENVTIRLLHMEASRALVSTLKNAIHKHARHHPQCLRRQRIVKESGETGESATQNVVSQDNRKRYIR